MRIMSCIDSNTTSIATLIPLIPIMMNFIAFSPLPSSTPGEGKTSSQMLIGTLISCWGVSILERCSAMLKGKCWQRPMNNTLFLNLSKEGLRQVLAGTCTPSLQLIHQQMAAEATLLSETRANWLKRMNVEGHIFSKAESIFSLALIEELWLEPVYTF